MTDNEQLLQMQADYKNGDSAALTAMYTKLFEIAYKTINACTGENELIANMTVTDRKQKAHDAATYIIEQYLKRPGFKIEKSVTGYLYRRINYELYGRFNRACDKLLIFADFSKNARAWECKRKTGRQSFRYIVKDTKTGKTESYGSAAELYQDPRFKGLRKKRLAEAIRTGRKWKNYIFDLLEVNE